MNYLNVVASRRNFGKCDLSPGVGNGVIGRSQSDHDRAHLRMNIAEDKRNARLVEVHKAGRSAFVQAQVETFAFEEREHIVKKRITIGKLHLSPNRYHNDRRM